MAIKNKKRTRAQAQAYARNRATAVSRMGREKIFESDGTYFLKLVACVLLGAFWLKFKQPFVWTTLTFSGFPVGLFIGLILVNKLEKFQADRKIWYATLIVVGIISNFMPSGLVL